MRLWKTAAMLVFISVFTCLAGQIYAQDPRVVGMWMFDEGSGNQVMDRSGNGHAGVAVDGDLEWVEGKFGSALKFNHDGIRVHIEHDNVFNLETFTIECWVKLESANGDWQTLIAKRTTGADTTYIVEIDKSDDTPRIALASEGVWKAGLINGTTVVTDNVWHHLAATYDGNELKFYVDGELEGTQQATLKPEVNDAPFSIGADSYNSKPVIGLIDEVQVLNAALSQDEIRKDMDGLKPAAVEASGKLSTTWGDMKIRY